MDIYYEQMLKKKLNAVDWVKIIASGLVALNFTLFIVFCFLAGITFYGFNFLIILGLWWGFAWIIKGTSVEYEYTITNHELDIDIIKGKSKRKHITTINLKNIEFFGNVGDERIIEILNARPKPKKSYYLLPDRSADNICVTEVISKKDNSIVRVFVAPDSQLFEYIWKANPKVVIREETR